MRSRLYARHSAWSGMRGQDTVCTGHVPVPPLLDGHRDADTRRVPLSSEGQPPLRSIHGFPLGLRSQSQCPQLQCLLPLLYLSHPKQGPGPCRVGSGSPNLTTAGTTIHHAPTRQPTLKKLSRARGVGRDPLWSSGELGVGRGDRKVQMPDVSISFSFSLSGVFEHCWSYLLFLKTPPI